MISFVKKHLGWSVNKDSWLLTLLLLAGMAIGSPIFIRGALAEDNYSTSSFVTRQQWEYLTVVCCDGGKFVILDVLGDDDKALQDSIDGITDSVIKTLGNNSVLSQAMYFDAIGEYGWEYVGVISSTPDGAVMMSFKRPVIEGVSY